MNKFLFLLTWTYLSSVSIPILSNGYSDSLNLLIDTSIDPQSRIQLQLQLAGYFKSTYNGDSLIYVAQQIVNSEHATKVQIGLAVRYLGTGYYYAGDYENAKIEYENSAVIFEEENELNELQISLNNVGIMYEIFGHLDSALILYGRSLRIAEELQDYEGLGDIYNNMAIVYNLKGERTEAFSLYQKSLKYEKLEGDSVGVADTYANLGAIYYALGMYEETIDYMVRAGNIYSHLGDTVKLAMIYANVATNYFSLKQFDLSLRNFEKAAKIQDQLPDSDTKLSRLVAQANLYMETSDTLYLKAILLKSLKMAQRLNAQHSLGKVLATLGKYYLEYEMSSDSAQYFYMRSFDVRNSINDLRGQATSLLSLADIDIRKNDLSNALQKLQSVQVLADSLKSKFIFGELVRSWSDYYVRSGSYDKAYEYLSLYKSYNDSILNESNSAYIGRTEGKFQLQIEIDQELREEQERNERMMAQLNYEQSLQFRLIGMFSSLFFLIILSLKFFTLNEKTLRMVIFIFSLLLFEFFLVFLDQYVDDYTNSVVFKLSLNVVLALLIIPIHSVLSKFLRNFLVQK